MRNWSPFINRLLQVPDDCQVDGRGLRDVTSNPPATECSGWIRKSRTRLPLSAMLVGYKLL